MIEEAYCSYEVSKLLKENGFDEECRSYFIDNGDDIRNCAVHIKSINCINSQMLRPTHQMAMRWLRECWKDKNGCIEGLSIEPYAAAYRYGFTISRVPTGSHVCNEKDIYPYEEFENYEESTEAALKYCLEHLEELKKK